LVAWGIFKKVVIADRAAVLVNQVFGDFSQYAGLEIYIAVLLFCVQIYADFSGGIDVARGIAQTMGIKLSENFKRPYFARSISEFWQRWHITLGSWMRDYLFYPLCLSKPFVKLGKLSRKIFGNIIGKILPVVIVTFIVFIVIGIWHGASWKYIAFGMYNGVLITLGLIFAPLLTRMERKFGIRKKSIGWRLFQNLRTFFLCSVGRYFSRAASFKTSITMMGATVAAFNPEIFANGRLFELGLSKANFAVLGFSILILFFVSMFQEKGFHIRQKLSEQRIVIRWTIYFIFLFYIIIFGNYGIGFDANSFIYMGF
jgi:D-alanyl-lipoteichoic acid acyltransferase DltB (MBOAT superfamily)